MKTIQSISSDVFTLLTALSMIVGIATGIVNVAHWLGITSLRLGTVVIPHPAMVSMSTLMALVLLAGTFRSGGITLIRTLLLRVPLKKIFWFFVRGEQA